MRIRTDDDKEYRIDEIMRTNDFYDLNKTEAVISACENVPDLVAAAAK